MSEMSIESGNVKAVRLYVAGVISGDPRPFEEKRDAFYDGAARLRAAGIAAVNPLEVGNPHCELGPGVCRSGQTRVTVGHDQGDGHAWECYLRHDLIEMLACDGVALLPNWHLSPGARLEFATASAVGLSCKPLDDWLTIPPKRTATEDRP